MIIGSEKKEFAKKEIRAKIMELKKQINNYEKDILEIDETIKRDCVRKYGQHEFERERDDGPYPETWWVCKHCGYEK